MIAVMVAASTWGNWERSEGEGWTYAGVTDCCGVVAASDEAVATGAVEADEICDYCSIVACQSVASATGYHIGLCQRRARGAGNIVFRAWFGHFFGVG